MISSTGRAKKFSGRMGNIWRILSDVTYPIVAYTTVRSISSSFLFAKVWARVTSSIDHCIKHSMTCTLKICGYHISVIRRTLSPREWKFMRRVMPGDTFVRYFFVTLKIP